MIAFIFVLLILMLWTVGSIIWFFGNFGKKYHEDTYFDYVMAWPMLLIIMVLLLFRNLRK